MPLSCFACDLYVFLLFCLSYLFFFLFIDCITFIYYLISSLIRHGLFPMICCWFLSIYFYFYILNTGNVWYSYSSDEAIALGYHMIMQIQERMVWLSIFKISSRSLLLFYTYNTVNVLCQLKKLNRMIVSCLWWRELCTELICRSVWLS